MLADIRAEVEAERASGPLAVLGLRAGATREQVTAAYRERVKTSPPDRGGSAEEFRRVREAYEALQG